MGFLRMFNKNLIIIGLLVFSLVWNGYLTHRFIRLTDEIEIHNKILESELDYLTNRVYAVNDSASMKALYNFTDKKLENRVDLLERSLGSLEDSFNDLKRSLSLGMPIY